MRAQAPERPGPELLAIVDLGSTAVRFLLARITPGAGYRVLAEAREPTRLGGGAAGTLPRQAIVETLRAVRRFFSKHSSSGRGPRVVAVATSAVRDARNREELLGPLRRAEGITVEVLSARDEARLGVAAALESLPFRDGGVADLGGASLQLSRVRSRAIVSSASLPLGAVRTTLRFLRHDPPAPREIQALRRHVWAQLLPAWPAAGRGEVLVGLGGTAAPWQASICGRTAASERIAMGSRSASPTSPRSANGWKPSPTGGAGRFPASSRSAPTSSWPEPSPSRRPWSPPDI